MRVASSCPAALSTAICGLPPGDDEQASSRHGDQITRDDLYFGYPQAHEHDAERAVLAGLALVGAVPKLTTAVSTALQVRIGIATRLVVVGDLIGSGEAQEPGVVGDTPNLAAGK
jgi:class 3 adenylate cyclase